MFINVLTSDYFCLVTLHFFVVSHDALFSHVTLFVVYHDAILYFAVFCMCIYWIFSVEMINL